MVRRCQEILTGREVAVKFVNRLSGRKGCLVKKSIKALESVNVINSIKNSTHMFKALLSKSIDCKEGTCPQMC